ncbi:hypothetical protein FDECE_3388 [Fusarium decemcellulare]|nr:hypothetical protein FDECE_3388 [Fusarium decemcellulare]
MSFSQKPGGPSTPYEAGLQGSEWKPRNLEEYQREFLDKFREASAAGREEEMIRLIAFAEASIAERRREPTARKSVGYPSPHPCSREGLGARENEDYAML